MCQYPPPPPSDECAPWISLAFGAEPLLLLAGEQSAMPMAQANVRITAHIALVMRRLLECTLLKQTDDYVAAHIPLLHDVVQGPCSTSLQSAPLAAIHAYMRL
jgi:hypothetical protein